MEKEKSTNFELDYCECCKKQWPGIIIMISDKNGKRTFCPNCLALSYVTNKLNLENDNNLVDELTGKQGAVKFVSGDEKYILEKETMYRLIAKNLNPEEHKSLVKKHGWNAFELHNDFYDSKHNSIQPIDMCI